MNPISANDLKTRGIAAIDAALAAQTEAAIAVRGENRFVVMSLAHYRYLRACELEAALAETRADLSVGRFSRETPEAHLAQLDSEA